MRVARSIAQADEPKAETTVPEEIAPQGAEQANGRRQKAAQIHYLHSSTPTSASRQRGGLAAPYPRACATASLDPAQRALVNENGFSLSCAQVDVSYDAWVLRLLLG